MVAAHLHCAYVVDKTASVSDRKRRSCLESAVINRCRIVIGVEGMVYPCLPPTMNRYTVHCTKDPLNMYGFVLFRNKVSSMSGSSNQAASRSSRRCKENVFPFP